MTCVMRWSPIAAVLLLAATALADDTRKEPAADRPETPTRQAVVAAMNAVQPAARRCGESGWHGLVPVRLVFEGGHGATTSVTASTANVPPEVARCVEHAASFARVPPFRAARFTVNYPFRI